MMNMPEVKLGIVAVSRDCFPDHPVRVKKKSSGSSL